MLKKIYRLTWKDVNFIHKKQNIIFGKFFSFFYYDQYPNKSYNQFSINIPLKLSKKATLRNQLKRSLYKLLVDMWVIWKHFNNKFYKVFVVLNKKILPDIQQTIENLDKKNINQYIDNIFSEDFSKLQRYIWQSYQKSRIQSRGFHPKNS